MPKEDYIFNDLDEEEEIDEEEELKGSYSEGDKLFLNAVGYTITEFIKAKSLEDSVGLPVIYSWYKAKNEETDEEVNVFFYDDDPDSVEPNDKVAEKWFEDYAR